ncbi:MAG: bile acid:sodium symporter family protein [Fermentimonas sp.]|jgi:BASS family bile acid:Na+ symporter
MKLYQFLEKFFWIFLITGLVTGLIFPIYNDLLLTMLKPLLMIMLLLVFLKTDIGQIFSRMKNYRLMTFIVLMNMIIIPLSLFYVIQNFDNTLALGILLLTAMPAAVGSTALTDIVEGNIALSTSIVIVTSVIAPFTIPLLFWITGVNKLSLNLWYLLRDLSFIIFLPMLTSQILKRYLPDLINRANHIFTSINVIILAVMVYIAIASQRDLILSQPRTIFWQIGFLYLIFILLHIIGFFMGFKEDLKDKIAITIGSAYMNNGLAIVLAAVYFEPSILFLVVLSELPWNTLLMPFRRVIKYIQKVTK